MHANEVIMGEHQNNCHSLPLNGGKFIAVITQDGRLILEDKPYLTLIKLIEYVGIETVAALDLKAKDEMPLISKTRFTLRDYQPCADGWFVYTTMNKKDKLKMIEQIGELTGQKFFCATKLI